MGENKRTVIIVGAGVIGAAIALELQRRGRQVTLVDKAGPGEGTSFGNMASIALDFAAGSGPSTWSKIPGWLLDPEGPVWLRPSYALRMLPWFLRFVAAGRPSRLREIEDAGMSLSRHALSDFRAMLAAAGAPDLMTEEGCLSIYETEAEFAGDRAHLELMQRYGMEYKVLAGAEIRDHEPALSPSIAKAVLLPDNKSIRDPYKLVLTLMEARGAEGERPLIVVLGQLRVLVVLDDLEHPEADCQHGEDARDDVLQQAQANRDSSRIFNQCHDSTPDPCPLRAPPFHRSGQQLDELKCHDADRRIAHRLFSDRRVRRAEMPEIEQCVQPHEHRRMQHRRPQEHDKPRQGLRHDELCPNNAR